MRSKYKFLIYAYGRNLLVAKKGHEIIQDYSSTLTHTARSKLLQTGSNNLGITEIIPSWVALLPQARPSHLNFPALITLRLFSLSLLQFYKNIYKVNLTRNLSATIYVYSLSTLLFIAQLLSVNKSAICTTDLCTQSIYTYNGMYNFSNQISKQSKYHSELFWNLYTIFLP